jgi:DNA-directed RNA polymerase subunit RPC12/RpoP
MSRQMCLNCGEKPAVPQPGGKTAPLCAECGSKISGSRGVKMTPKETPKPKLRLVKGARATS